MATTMDTNKNQTGPATFSSKVFHDGTDLEKMSQQAGEKIGALASDVKNSASDYIKAASQYVEGGRQYVRTNPARSIAIAATAGLVAGGIVSLFMRRKQ